MVEIGTTARFAAEPRARRLRVLVADGEPVFVEGFSAACEREEFLVVGAARRGDEAVVLVRELRPDVAVLAFVMPGLSGVEAAGQIGQTTPDTHVLLLGTMIDERRLADAWQAGARGVVLRSQTSTEMAYAIREVAAGRVYVCRVDRSGLYRAADATDANRRPLSRRELQVLQLIAEGQSRSQIAALLRIAPKTVDHHREHIRKKLGLRSTVLLVRWAIRVGLVVP